MRISIDQDLRPDQVARIEVTAHPLVKELTGLMQPSDALEAKVSIGHAVAVALARRTGGPREFEDAAVRDPVIAALRDRVVLSVDPAFGRAEAKVVIATTDGRRFEHHVRDALGSRDRPMSDADLVRKVEGLAVSVIGQAKVNQLVALCSGVDGLRDVGQIGQQSRA